MTHEPPPSPPAPSAGRRTFPDNGTRERAVKDSRRPDRSRSRSLSPFSRRLALTQQLNRGQDGGPTPETRQSRPNRQPLGESKEEQASPREIPRGDATGRKIKEPSLEPHRKPRERSKDRRRDRSRDTHRDRSRDRRRDRSVEKRRDRSKESKRDRSKERRRHRSRSRDRERDREKDRDRDRYRDRDRDRGHDRTRDKDRARRRSRSRHRRSKSPPPRRSLKRRSSSNSPPLKRRKRTRSPSRSPAPRNRNPLPSQELSFRGTDNSADAPTKYGGAPKTLEKPNFKTTGALAKAANKVEGTKITLKYHEPPEARKPSPSSQWRIFVFKGDDVVDTIELHTRSCWLLGRSAEVVDYVLEHPSSSGQHAVIQFRYVPKIVEDEFGVKQQKGKVKPYIIDLESSNGTELNGKAVETSRYFELRDKDILRFAGSEREYVVMLPPVEK